MLGFMFPGQGVQHSQMLVPIKNYKIDVSRVFKTVSEAYGVDIEKLIETSTQEILRETRYTQMVMFASDMAYYEVIKKMGIEPNWVAGHSLGQYAAFVAAGAVDLYEASCLIRQRSDLMSKVRRTGKLCAISSPVLDEELIRLICIEIEEKTKKCLRIALYNSNYQVVVGGESEAVLQLEKQLLKKTDYKVTVLSVGQAFHTPIMNEMIDEFQIYIDKLNIRKPNIPIILNRDGEILTCQRHEQVIKEEMRKQCNQPVQWKKTIKTMLSMKTKISIEVGPGRVLCGFLKNMSKNIKTYYMEDRKSFMKAIKIINSCIIN